MVEEVWYVAVNQCSVLLVRDRGENQAAALRAMGFAVHEAVELPPADAACPYHAVVVEARHDTSLPMLAARLRARAHFGRRVLIALVGPAISDRARREATMSGFDSTLDASCSARDLAATILKRLRPYPEYRCILRAPGKRRKAA
jgi:methylmalonyl-CoA mutase cobalamin-binding subunit